MRFEPANLIETIQHQLDVEPFTKNKILQKYLVVECARKGDEGLLKLLLANDQLKEKFFKKVGDALVFHHADFIWHVEQKNYLKDSYTQYKNKIGLTIDKQYMRQRNDVELAWPFKDCVLEGGQSREDDKRDEIFFNENLAHAEISQLLHPKVLSNAAVYDKSGKRAFKSFTRDAELNKNRDLPPDTITDNLIVKGNNLLALHSLKKQFKEKVKLIYIDPPYNTGGDANIFTYNNSFNHSTWLTFMKNRLEVARKFLREDGFIAIAIDHVELFYLGVLADEIFGRENRVGIVSIVNKSEGRQFAKFFSVSHENLIVYANDVKQAKFNDVVIDEKQLAKFDAHDEIGQYSLRKYINYNPVRVSGRDQKPDYWYPFYFNQTTNEVSLEEKSGWIEILPIHKGQQKTWQTTLSKAKERLANNELVVLANKQDHPEVFLKVRENQRFLTVWNDKKYHATEYGTKLLKKLVKDTEFSYPKSIHAVLDITKITTNSGDVVLDFFAGSGTTGHAVLALNKEDGGNRQFILVEQLGDHIDVCHDRITAVMKQENSGAAFVALELKRHNEKFVGKIKAVDTAKKLLGVWNEMMGGGGTRIPPLQLNS